MMEAFIKTLVRAGAFCGREYTRAIIGFRTLFLDIALLILIVDKQNFYTRQVFKYYTLRHTIKFLLALKSWLKPCVGYLQCKYHEIETTLSDACRKM